MSTPAPIDLDSLRRSCGHCSLRQLCLPADIGIEDLARLDEVVRRRRPLRRDERLFRHGDALSSIYVARNGAFKTVSLSESGDERVIGFHLPGELMGLDALANGAHRCEAVALDPAEVCEVPVDDLAGVAAQLPGLQRQLMRVIGQSIALDRDHAEMLARRHANERIALFLHGLGERLGHIGQSSLRFRLAMSREDIASYLGLAIETVSRGFSRLQEDRVITVSGRQVEVLDPAELVRLAHGGEAPAEQQRQA
jgi:CRP/FNR family transcriptional regulator